MSKECLENRACPIIRECLRKIEDDGFLMGSLSFLTDDVATDTKKLMQACIESYNCDGPKIKEVEIERGIFKVKKVIEKQQFCGLDK